MGPGISWRHFPEKELSVAKNVANVASMKRELKRAEAKVKAVLQAERRFRPMLKKASPAERAQLKLSIKSLKGLYRKIENLVSF
jgi:hypothetical protein